MACLHHSLYYLLTFCCNQCIEKVYFSTQDKDEMSVIFSYRLSKKKYQTQQELQIWKLIRSGMNLFDFSEFFYSKYIFFNNWENPFSNQGLVKGTILCFRNLYFYFRHGESTSPASQKSKDLNKVPLLLQDLGKNTL